MEFFDMVSVIDGRVYESNVDKMFQADAVFYNSIDNMINAFVYNYYYLREMQDATLDALDLALDAASIIKMLLRTAVDNSIIANDEAVNIYGIIKFIGTSVPIEERTENEWI